MTTYSYGSGQTYATPQEAFDALQAANETGSLGAHVFTGSGLDDFTSSGTPASGKTAKNFRVEIDGTGTPDTFKWSNDNGATWEAETVAITGAAQALEDGVSVTFAATTGHTSADRWDFSTTYTVNDFSASNIIRGVGSATYLGASAGEPVLRLCHSVGGRGVSPTAAYPLTLDVNGPDQVAWVDDQNGGCLINGAADGAELASHVRVRGLTLRSLASTVGAGIIICQDRTGGESCSDWAVDDCVIEASAAGVIAGCCAHLALVDTVIKGNPSSAGIYADGASGTYGALAGALSLSNTAIKALGPALSIRGDIHCHMAHCALSSFGQVVVLNQGAAGQISMDLDNSILYTSGAAVEVLATDLADLIVMAADANCYYNDGSDLADLDGTALADLAALQDRFGQDAHSSFEDPLFADDSLTLDAGSPCLLTGRAAVNSGIEGQERAMTIDKGPYQVSVPAAWRLRYAGGKITAAINGSVDASGL
jgi:hypothetical protein